MAIDILNVSPNVVSRDLSGYSVLVYGPPKIGKTTLASKFPKTLLLATEKGYSAIPGILAVDILSWADFKRVVSQLKSDDAHKAYSTIAIDTIDILYDLCEKYICANEGINEIGDIKFGGGYKKASLEFDNTLRKIVQMNYGLVMTSHAVVKDVEVNGKVAYTRVTPSLGATPKKVVLKMTDIIAYAQQDENEDGSFENKLYLRGSKTLEAGSRFRYMADSIPFTYDALTKAIQDAIQKEEQASGSADLFTDERIAAPLEEKVNFNELKAEFNSVIEALQKGYSSDQFSSYWAPKIVSIIEGVLGKGRRVEDLEEGQEESLKILLIQLKEAVEEGMSV